MIDEAAMFNEGLFHGRLESQEDERGIFRDEG